MLLNYRASNFCSFDKEFEFSMKPGKVMERFEDNVSVLENKLKVSKLAVIAGENAGGKTSFMKSLDYMKYCISNSDKVRSIKNLQHKYNDTSNQFFEIIILAENNKIYTYYLEIDKYYIVKESLKYRNFNQCPKSNITIFEFKRDDNLINNGNHFGFRFDIYLNEGMIRSEIIKLVESQIKSGNIDSHIPGSYVNYLYKLNVEYIKPFIDWINDKLIVELPINATLDIYKAMAEDLNDLSIMEEDSFLEIFKLVDSSIVGIEVDKEDPYKKSIIIRELGNGAKFRINLGSESSGTKEFFAWSVQIWKVIYKDATLFADEIDKVLNPILSSKIISYIKGSDHKGQFIFSTHNVMHLNTRDFMKEQIYFISKDRETAASELYSLKEFKDYRYEKSNVYELYLRGILGGVPNG